MFASSMPVTPLVHSTTGTLRDWVIAFNPDTIHRLFCYRIFDIFCPFGIALEQTWALRNAFTQVNGQWQFMGHPLSAIPHTLQGPAYSELTAFEALEAIDAFDLKALQAHQFRLRLKLSVFAICLTVLIYLLPFIASSFLNSSFGHFSFLLCVCWGVGLTSLGYVCHRKTTLGRKAIIPPKEIEELQRSVLMFENAKDWGPAVQSIFQKIKSSHNMPAKMTISDLVDTYIKTIRSLHDLATQLNLANETNCKLTDLLNQARKFNDALGQQTTDLVRQLSELSDDLKTSRENLSQRDAMISALEIKLQDLDRSQKDLAEKLTAAEKNNQKLQASLAVSNGLLEHTRQDYQCLERRLDVSITKQATIQSDLNRVSAEALQANRDQKASVLSREEATVSARIQQEKIADLEKKLSAADDQIRELKDNLSNVKSQDGSIFIAGDSLENLVLQNQAQGLNCSIGIPIAIMTWASFQDDPPDGQSQIGYTVQRRLRASAKNVRTYASTLPQYRGLFYDESFWENYLSNIEKAVTTVMLPPKHDGKIPYSNSNFNRAYPSVVRKNR